MTLCRKTGTDIGKVGTALVGCPLDLEKTDRKQEESNSADPEKGWFIRWRNWNKERSYVCVIGRDE
jgi:hypothetical protein